MTSSMKLTRKDLVHLAQIVKALTIRPCGELDRKKSRLYQSWIGTRIVRMRCSPDDPEEMCLEGKLLCPGSNPYGELEGDQKQPP